MTIPFASRIGRIQAVGAVLEGVNELGNWIQSPGSGTPSRTRVICNRRAVDENEPATHLNRLTEAEQGPEGFAAADLDYGVA